MINHLLEIGQYLVEPFQNFGFMRRSLVACFALAISSGPLGLLILYRRLSLMGDALSHAILPGVAMGFFFFNGNGLAMVIGGFVAAFVVSLLSESLHKWGQHSNESSFGIFYLLSLAIGTLFISIRGSSADLLHILFGNIIMLTNESLLLLIAVSLLTLLLGFVFLRPFLTLTVDSKYLRNPRRWSFFVLILLSTNMVAGFQALGTLLAIGILLIPAAAASFWSEGLFRQWLTTMFFTIIAGYIGLLASFYWNWPAGSSVILVLGVLFAISFFWGPAKGIFKGHFKKIGFTAKRISSSVTHRMRWPGVSIFVLASFSPYLSEKSLALPAPKAKGDDLIKIACSTPISCNFVEILLRQSPKMELGSTNHKSLVPRPTTSQEFNSKMVCPEILHGFQIIPLMRSGSNAHDFEPTPETILKIKESDIIVANGLNYDYWLEPLIKQNKLTKKIVWLGSKISPVYRKSSPPHSQEQRIDPHAWLSALNGLLYMESLNDYLHIEILANLREEDNEKFSSLRNPDVLRQIDLNYKNFRKNLQDFHQEQIRLLQGLKTRKTYIILTHPFLDYWGKDYGVQEQLFALQSEDHHESLSPHKIASIIKSIKSFASFRLYEDDHRTSLAMETVLRELKSPKSGVLYSESLWPEANCFSAIGKYGETLRKNLETLIQTEPKSAPINTK